MQKEENEKLLENGNKIVVLIGYHLGTQKIKKVLFCTGCENECFFWRYMRSVLKMCLPDR